METLNFARGKFNNVRERAREETVIFTTNDTDNRHGYNAHEDWSIAIDMQIARIISTLNVRRQRERHQGGVTITGRRFQRVPCAFSDNGDSDEEEEEGAARPVVIRH